MSCMLIKQRGCSPASFLKLRSPQYLVEQWTTTAYHYLGTIVLVFRYRPSSSARSNVRWLCHVSHLPMPGWAHTRYLCHFAPCEPGNALWLQCVPSQQKWRLLKSSESLCGRNNHPVVRRLSFYPYYGWQDQLDELVQIICCGKLVDCEQWWVLAAEQVLATKYYTLLENECWNRLDFIHSTH